MVIRITSVKSSIGIINHQGHISQVSANSLTNSLTQSVSQSLTNINSIASCDAKNMTSFPCSVRPEKFHPYTGDILAGGSYLSSRSCNIFSCNISSCQILLKYILLQYILWLYFLRQRIKESFRFYHSLVFFFGPPGFQ